MSKKSYGVGWVLTQLNRSRSYSITYVRKKNFVNEKPLFLCPRCNCVWGFVKKPKGIERYDDFPSLNLEKIICKECEDKNAK